MIPASSYEFIDKSNAEKQRSAPEATILVAAREMPWIPPYQVFLETLGETHRLSLQEIDAEALPVTLNKESSKKRDVLILSHCNGSSIQFGRRFYTLQEISQKDFKNITRLFLVCCHGRSFAEKIEAVTGVPVFASPEKTFPHLSWLVRRGGQLQLIQANPEGKITTVYAHEGKREPLDSKMFIEPTLRKLIAKGSTAASTVLGWYYKVVEKKPAAAFRAFLLAARKGEAFAEYEVACAYREGRGPKKDRFLFLSWLRRAAEHGNPSAQNSLGVHLAKERSFEAYEWFCKSAGQGDEMGIENAKKWEAIQRKFLITSS